METRSGRWLMKAKLTGWSFSALHFALPPSLLAWSVDTMPGRGAKVTSGRKEPRSSVTSSGTSTCSGLPAQILRLVRKTPALLVYARETKSLFHEGEQNPNYGSVLSRPLQVLGSTCLQGLSIWSQADIGEKGKERPKGIQ